MVATRTLYTFHMLRIVATLLALMAGTVALARTPPMLPEPVVQAQPDLALVGQGTLNWLMFRVYDAWLWAPGGNWEEDAPFVLDLRYARTLKGSAIVDRSIEEMRRLGASDAAPWSEWEAFMLAAFPDVGEGDRLTGEFLPQGVTRFYHNGEFAGEIEDPEFGRLFAGIWLAPSTSVPRLRVALLGGEADSR